MRALRLLLGVVTVAALPLALAFGQPWRSYFTVAFFTALFAWALVAAGQFFLAEGERGARVDPDRVERARWVADAPGTLEVVARGRAERLDGDVAPAMAAALERRGVPIEGEPPKAKPAAAGTAFVDASGRLQKK